MLGAHVLRVLEHVRRSGQVKRRSCSAAWRWWFSSRSRSRSAKGLLGCPPRRQVLAAQARQVAAVLNRPRGGVPAGGLAVTPVRYLVAYDIADDDRREGVALYLSGYGPRVQLSVFDVELADLDKAWPSATASAP